MPVFKNTAKSAKSDSKKVEITMFVQVNLKEVFFMEKKALQKKVSVWMLTAALAAVMCLFCAMPALAANSIEVKAGKTDIGNINLSSETHSYTITIDKDSFAWADENGASFNIKMDNVTLNFKSAAFYTDAYKKALQTNKPVQVKLYVKTKYGIDMGKYFTSGKNSNYLLTTKGTSVKAELLVSGSKKSDIYQLAAPITFKQDYREDWNAYNGGKKETGVTMAWYDMDRKLSSAPAWVRLSTKLDTQNKVAAAADIYTCGVIVPIVCTDLNNVTGTSSGGNSGNGGGTAPAGLPDGFWAKSDIEQMQQAGIVPTSLNYGQFNEAITRDEFVAYMVRSLRLSGEQAEAGGAFNDVSQSNPYYKEIYIGVQNSLVSGTSANTFSPNAKITREEMAAFFTRALSFKKQQINEDTSVLANMADSGSIAAWAKKSCAAAVNAGLITGKAQGGKTIFAPKDNTTRAESVVMLNRLRGNI